MYKKLFGFASLLLLLAALPSVAFAAEGRFERTLKVTGAPDVEVSTGSGSITIRAGDSSSIHIVGHIRSSNWFGGDASDRVARIEQHPPIVQVGNAIRIGHFDDPSLQRNISISYEITLPANSTVRSTSGSGDLAVDGVSASLKARTGSGSIRVTRGGGDLRAETGSGDISISGASGRLHAGTGSGSIEVVGSQLTNADVSTGSGSIRIDSVRGGFRAHTGSGDIRASGAITSAWEASSGSGTIVVNLAPGSGFNVDARSGSGTIKIEREITMQGEINRHHVQGKVGGGGPTLMLHTASGDIRVQ